MLVVIGCPLFYLCYLHINKLHTVWISPCCWWRFNWYRETSASLCHPCIDTLSQNLQSVHVNHCCGDCDNHTQHCTCQTTATTQLDLKAKYINWHPHTHTTFLCNISSFTCNETNFLHHLPSIYSVTVPERAGWAADSLLRRTTHINCRLYTLLPPGDGPLSNPKHLEVLWLNKLRIVHQVGLITGIYWDAVNKTKFHHSLCPPTIKYTVN
jgi:hypothetical protein